MNIQGITYHGNGKDLFGELTENIDEIFYCLDKDLQVLYWNRHAEIITGVKARDILHHSLYDFFPGMQDEAASNAFQTTIKTGKSQRFEQVFNTKNKQYIFETRVHAASIGLLVFSRDISHQKQPLGELESPNEKINALLGNLPVILFSTDSQGVYKTLMGMGMERINLKPEELIGRSAYQLYGNLTLETNTEQIHTIAGGLDHVLRGNKLLGTFMMNGRYINIKMVPEKNEAGRITGTMGVGLDVTDKQQAEKKLQNTYRLLERTLDSLKEVVMVVGDKKHRNIALCNKAVQEVFGYTPEELRGYSTRVLHIDDSHYQTFGKISEQELEKKGYFHGEYQMKRKDGTIITSEHTISPLDEQKGWRHGVVSIIRDISERKQYMKQIESYSKRLKHLTSHLQKLQEEERTRIAREIHDEVGQIFSIIKFNLNSLKKDLSGPSHSPPREQIRKEMEAMIDMTDNAIRSTRQFISELRPVVIDHMRLDEALEWLTQDFEKKYAIHTTFRKKTTVSKPGKQTKTHLFRILQETLTNVHRHAGASQVNVQLWETGKQLNLKIEDNGKGIQEQDKNKMSSLGLLGMQERVNDMGGTLSIEGQPGKGTTIVVAIPLEKQRL
jgi:PAS domain S-box-containing protein